MTEEAFQILVSALGAGILVAIATLVIRTGQMAKKKLEDNREQIIDATAKAVVKAGDVASRAYQSSIEIAQKVSDKDSSIDEKHFVAAYEEFKNGDKRQSLWIKELTLADQDEVKAEAGYIRARAREIRDSE